MQPGVAQVGVARLQARVETRDVALNVSENGLNGQEEISNSRGRCGDYFCWLRTQRRRRDDATIIMPARGWALAAQAARCFPGQVRVEFVG